MEPLKDNHAINFDIEIAEEWKIKLCHILPQVPTVITRLDFKDSLNESENQIFTVELRTNCADKESALNWKAKFEELSYNSYNIDSTFKENTLKTVFKCIYHCLHNTRPPKRVKTPHCKHVNCPAKLTINIKNSKMKRSKDMYLKKFPCVISIRYSHNHPIFCADVLRHKRPTQSVEEKFKQLFGKGHTPSSALEIYKMELQDLDPENYYKLVADGSQCPTRRWCYELYYRIFKKQYGDPSGPEMIKTLSKVINEYNEECGGICAAMASDENDLVIGICSPMMQYVHEYIKSSGEVLFIDSSGNMDRHNTRVFLMLCPSIVGALPLGVMLTYSESENTILKALELYKTLLNNSAFYKNTFPKVIITDDCTAERQALKKSFPASLLLLCKFHVLQSTMRYLWDSKHHIDKNDRIYIYKLFHNLVNCTKEQDFLESFENFLKSETCKKYKNVVKYFENLKKRSKEWALCYRFNVLTRGNHTNNYAEAGFRILKDKIFIRTKAFSIVQMFVFLTENLQSYYTRKITDVINNRSENLARKYFIKKDKIKDFKYEIISNCLYKVISGENEYFVNTDVELCTCYQGNSGAPCKHQYGVVKTFNLTSQQFIPTTDVKMKSILHKLVNNKIIPNSWYENLNNNLQNISVVNTKNEASPNNNLDNNDSSITLGSIVENSAERCQHFSQENIHGVSTNLLNIFENLNLKLLNNPEVFYPAIKRFNELYCNVKTVSSMVSALHSFGKYSGAGHPLIGKKKNLQGGRSIGVQPTALSRRKVHLGRRNVVYSGRPPKNTNDHLYHRRKRNTPSDLPSLRHRGVAPHSLSFCVDNNMSLGKTH